MKLKTEHIATIGGIVLLGLLTVWAFWRKAKKEELFAKYVKAINSGAGEDGEDIASLILNSYTAPADKTREARIVYDQTNYFMHLDDMDEILGVLNTSRSEVAAINRDFVSLYGFTLDTFLKDKLSESDYRRAVAVVKNNN